MNTILLDTVGLVAIWDEHDQWHDAAEAAMKILSARRIRFVATPQILLECGNAVARRAYRSEVYPLRQRLMHQQNLIVPSDDEMEKAWIAYESDTAGGASIVDHISFVILRRMGIKNVFTNDRHFKAAGFNTLF